MNLSQISKLNEDQAREYLERIRWPHGPVCAHCGVVDNAHKIEGETARAGLYRCRDCGEQFTVTVNSVMEQSHLPIRTWLMAFAIMCSSKKGVSALQLQRQLGLGSYRSAWHMAHRIRHAMTQEPLSGLLRGKIEVDETYVGGKPRPGTGKHKAGRGTKKTPVVALVERGGRVRAKPVASVDRRTLQGAIRENVHGRSMILTDSLASYQGVGRAYTFGHHTVNHLKGEYARGDVHTNTVESYFGLLKRSIVGSWHSVSKEHLPRYVNEVSFRWDYRKVSDSERTVAAIQQAEGKRLLYKATIRKPQ